MRLVPKEHFLSTCMLEGEDMSEFWEEDINDTCKITSENSALFLSKPCPTQETLSAVAESEPQEPSVSCPPSTEWSALNVLPECMILAFHQITHSLARMTTFCVPYVVVLSKSLGQLDWLANFLLVFCHADFYTCIL